MNISKYMRSALRFIRDEDYRVYLLCDTPWARKMPDEEYLKHLFKAKTGHTLHLEDPQTFNEKMQWLKLYDRKPIYTTMVDKFRARDYVAQTIGEEYLIPLLGVWDDPDDIVPEELPQRFVLKCNHNSGLGMCLCTDKSKLDWEQVKRDLRRGLAQDYYLRGREWPYKDVPRKIIAEQFMEQSVCHASTGQKPDSLVDYKFFCFNGKVQFLYASENLADADHEKAKISYITLDWQQAPFSRSDYARMETLPDKPQNFEKMIQLAEILAKDTYFLRVDFYEIDGKIYFSELTLFNSSGFVDFEPDSWNQVWGDAIHLPLENQ
jgi:hypothetical protein